MSSSSVLDTPADTSYCRSLATLPWSDERYLLKQLHRRGYRVAANEWDVFYSSMLRWRGAVFVTTFRHPVERFYSQYRFEHLEHRDGSTSKDNVIPMKQWYLSMLPWTMGRYCLRFTRIR